MSKETGNAIADPLIATALILTICAVVSGLAFLTEQPLFRDLPLGWKVIIPSAFVVVAIVLVLIDIVYGKPNNE